MGPFELHQTIVDENLKASMTSKSTVSYSLLSLFDLALLSSSMLQFGSDFYWSLLGLDLISTDLGCLVLGRAEALIVVVNGCWRWDCGMLFWEFRLKGATMVLVSVVAVDVVAGSRCRGLLADL
ncbi:hypothetical protein V6N13_072218 [Hibiscus sabdariffa]